MIFPQVLLKAPRVDAYIDAKQEALEQPAREAVAHHRRHRWRKRRRNGDHQRHQCGENAALWTATGYTQDTNIVHLHEETEVLPLNKHIRLITSQNRESCMDANLSQHAVATAHNPDDQMKMTAFDISYVTVIHSCATRERSRKRGVRTKGNCTRQSSANPL